jgi:RNA polymerase sigma factor (sigma-70 family)
MDPTALTDLDLLARRAAEGAPAAREALAASVRRYVYTLARRRLHDHEDAEDASQEVVITVLRHLASFRGNSAFSTWVHRIALNHLARTTRLRAERSSRLTSWLRVQEGEAFSPDPVLRLVAEQMRRCGKRAIARLDKAHREALILSTLAGLGSEEGATLLGISRAAFRQRVSRAVERLRTDLAAHCGLLRSGGRCPSCRGHGAARQTR